mgnify:CR=1 FL=1
MSKVTWEQLPKEIQQRMLECQVEQGKERNVNDFMVDLCTAFMWNKSKEGFIFWREILFMGNIDHFYTLYPKQKVSVMFWAVFETSKGKFQKQTLFEGDVTAKDFFEWCDEHQAKNKQETKAESVMLNGGIIR